jgi:hypothetical protein
MIKMQEKISKYILILSFVFFLLFCFFEKRKEKNIEIDINIKGKISVSKYVKQSIGKAKNEDIESNFFVFFIDKIEYKNNAGELPEGFVKNIGKFYRIKYSEKYKGEFKVFINEQVTDTTEILNAGFSHQHLPNYYFE